MPAWPLCIAIYLLELTEDVLQRNVGCSVITSALYGIRWAHKMAGLASNRPLLLHAGFFGVTCVCFL